MRIFLALPALLLTFATSLSALVVDWNEGTPIDVSVAVSGDVTKRPRFIKFPSNQLVRLSLERSDAKADAQVAAPGDQRTWTDGKMSVTLVDDNLLSVSLYNPDYSGGFSVVDDAKRTFIINVYAAPNPDEVDKQVGIRLPGTGRDGITASHIGDTDAAAIHMEAVMAGGVHDEDVQWTPVESLVRGQVVKGRVLKSNDLFTVMLTKMYVGPPPLRGYEITWTFKGTEGHDAFVVPIQRLWIPGAVCVCPGRMATLRSKNAPLTFRKNEPVKLWYVYVEPK